MTRSTIVRDRKSDFDFARLATDAIRPWQNAYESWRDGVTDLLERSSRKSDRCPKCRADHRDCQCGDDDCHCRCCVSDCDLLVEARVGERRIVPITIENHWRRERDIELELSSWTKLAADVSIEAKITTPAKFILKPCGEERVILAIEILDNRDAATGVRHCATSYADLLVKGCDMRSIRLAVAILPRDCDEYVVDCACGCC
jgi:hypothetical protein